jgi:hypothetical protein
MLALQVPFGAFAGHGRDMLRSMLRQRRPDAGLKLPRVPAAKAARHNADAIAIQNEFTGTHRMADVYREKVQNLCRATKMCSAPAPSGSAGSGPCTLITEMCC